MYRPSSAPRSPSVIRMLLPCSSACGRLAQIGPLHFDLVESGPSWLQAATNRLDLEELRLRLRIAAPFG
jgi:hypothetical protein